VFLQTEKEIEIKVQELGTFIEDKESLKLRLRLKQRIRRGHSV